MALQRFSLGFINKPVEPEGDRVKNEHGRDKEALITGLIMNEEKNGVKPADLHPGNGQGPERAVTK
jgi:hypothetical protein